MQFMGALTVVQPIQYRYRRYTSPLNQPRKSSRSSVATILSTAASARSRNESCGKNPSRIGMVPGSADGIDSQSICVSTLELTTRE